MLLEGSIHRFNLAGVLQFLAQGAATGVLEVRDFEEYGFIYLVRGRVEAISLPITDEKLGTRLMKAGCLTEQQLSEALMEDSGLSHDQKKFKPLGQRLIEKGYTTRDDIRHIMERQTMDQVFELAHWTSGVFLYEEPELMPRFQVAIEGDVQGLLLDAYRRIDEGERARKTPQRRRERGLLCVPARRRVRGGDQGQVPQEGRLPLAGDGRGPRREQRPPARCPPALSLARDGHEDRARRLPGF